MSGPQILWTKKKTVFYCYEFEVNLSQSVSGAEDFVEFWDYVNPYGIIVQTSTGERYLSESYLHDWYYQGDGNFTFWISKYEFLRDNIDMLQDSSFSLLFSYRKMQFEYTLSHRDILFSKSNLDADHPIILKKSDGTEISDISEMMEIDNEKVLFSTSVLDTLSIGENFSILYDIKYKGGLLESKKIHIELQPWEMTLYNKYNILSGGSIIAPFDYDLSSNKNYHIALNYRMIEKEDVHYEVTITRQDILENEVQIKLGDNSPLIDSEGEPMFYAYLFKSKDQKQYIDFDYIHYDVFNNEITITDLDLYNIEENNVLHVESVFAGQNKYQLFHRYEIKLDSDNYALADLDVSNFYERDDYLIPDLEGPNFIYNVEEKELEADGKVENVYIILNESNSYFTYKISPDLNDNSGWTNYDKLIAKFDILNVELLKNIQVDFYCDIPGDNNYLIGTIICEAAEIDKETGAAYIDIPESQYLQYFKRENSAYIKFTPEFYSASDFDSDYYSDGVPINQEIFWDEDSVEGGYMGVELDNNPMNLEESIAVYNLMGELLYEIDLIESEEWEGITYYRISLPEYFNDSHGNLIKMEDNDGLRLKYKTELKKEAIVKLGAMVLERGEYITDFRTGEHTVSPVEISLLGYNHTSGSKMETVNSLYNMSDSITAWRSSLDLTPFENEFFDTYYSRVLEINISEIQDDFKTNYNGIDYVEITDILITSNDPRYNLVIDNLMIMESDPYGTNFRSDYADLYSYSQFEKYYIGNYSLDSVFEDQKYSLDIGDHYPVYYNDDLINETFYFRAHDDENRMYYFDHQLSARLIEEGLYEITHNKSFSEEFEALYNTAENDEECYDLLQKYDVIPSKYNYLTISYASNDSWNEWKTIDDCQFIDDTLSVSHQISNGSEYHYNSSLGELDIRCLHYENLPLFGKTGYSSDFLLSQNYTTIENFGIQSIEAEFYNETVIQLDASQSYIYSNNQVVYIELTEGFSFNDFTHLKLIINSTHVPINLTCDAAQFRLTPTAKENNPNSHLWSPNDILWISYECVEPNIDLLFDDPVSSSEDDTQFDYINFTRNEFYTEFSNGNYEFDANAQWTTFKALEEFKDLSVVIELGDYDYDGRFEHVIEKRDIMGDGIYDSIKYGCETSEGDILFYTLLQEISYTVHPVQTRSKEYFATEEYEINTESPFKAFGDIWDDFWRGYTIHGKRKMEKTFSSEQHSYYSSQIIQEDIDRDGNVDKEFVYDLEITTTETNYEEIEVTEVKWKPINLPFVKLLEGIVNFITGEEPEFERFPYTDKIKTIARYQTKNTVGSKKFLIREFNETGVESMRLYEDIFSNEDCNSLKMDNYISEVVNDQGDLDLENDEAGLICQLEDLLGLRHERDNVPSDFDTVIISEYGNTASANILEQPYDVYFPGNFGEINGFSNNVSITGIKNMPKDGVIYDIKIGGSPITFRSHQSFDDPGYYYLYVDGDNDQFHETILTLDSNGNVLGVGFDYDQNGILDPNREETVDYSTVKRDINENDYYDTYDLLQDHSFFKHIEEKDTIELFSDAYFQISDVKLDGAGVSNLHQQAQDYASDQFWEDICLDQYIEDIGWEVAAGIVGAVGGGIAGPAGFIGGYMAIKLLQGFMDLQAQENALKYLSYHRTDSSKNAVVPDDNTISEKLWVDEWFDGLATNVIYGNRQGVYMPIKKVVEDEQYSASIVLSPRDKMKSTGLISINYQEYNDHTLPTRNYLYLSYELAASAGDQNKISSLHNQITGTPYKFHHWENAIPYVEDEMYDETSGLKSPFDTVIFNEADGIPMLDWASSYGQLPVPEFYNDFPLIVSESNAAEETFSIYRVFRDGSTDTLKLLPSDSAQSFNWEVDSIEVWEYNGWRYESKAALTENDDFSINYEEAEVQLYTSTVQNLENEGNEFVLQIKVKDTHSVGDRSLQSRNYTLAELQRIRFMQMLEADLLDYCYQFQLATANQQMINEMTYTVAMTIPSVIITAGATAIMGKASGVLASKLAEKSIMGRTSGALSQFSAKVLKMVGYQSMKSFVFKTMLSAGTESLQEVAVDPLLEAAVQNVARECGLNLYGQMIASTLAESGREGLSGQFSLDSSTRTSEQGFATYLEEQGYQAQKDLDGSELSALKEAYEQSLQRSESLRKVGKSISVSVSTLLTFGTAMAACVSGGFMGAATLGGIYLTTEISESLSEKVSMQALQKKVAQEVDALLTANFEQTDYAEGTSLGDIYNRIAAVKSRLLKNELNIQSADLNAEVQLRKAHCEGSEIAEKVKSKVEKGTRLTEQEIIQDYVDTFIEDSINELIEEYGMYGEKQIQTEGKFEDIKTLDKTINPEKYGVLPTQSAAAYSSQRELLVNNLRAIFENNIKNWESVTITQFHVSKLLGKSNTYLMDTFINKKSQPEYYEIFELILRARNMKLSDFPSQFEIDQDGLNRIKQRIESEIEKFVFSEYSDATYSRPKYDTGYVTNIPRRGDADIRTKEYLKAEYNVLKEVWISFMLYENNPRMSANKIMTNLDNFMCDLVSQGSSEFSTSAYENFGTINSPYNYLTKGENNIDPVLLKAIKMYFDIIIKEGGLDYSINAQFEITIDSILNYASERGIKLDGNAYPKGFYSDNVVAYHLVKMIMRNLGFDILHFSPLDGKIFVATKAQIKAGQATFIRHHFRDLDPWIRKLSMKVGDMILTDDKLHHDYEAFMSDEVKMVDLLSKFQQLMEREGTITVDTIKDIFGDNHWIYKYWNINSKGFQANLQEFNERKSFYGKLNRLSESRQEELFISRFYKDNLYSRFFESKKTLSFKTTMDRGLDRIIAHHNNRDIIQYLGPLP